MTAILTATLLLSGPSTEGLAQFYADSVMERVAENRIAWGHIPPDTDPRFCAAVIDCSWVGESIRVLWPDGRVMWGTVCDCSADEDRARHLEKGLAVEVSWWAAGEYAHPIGPYLLPRDGPLDGVTVELWDWESLGEWR